MNTYRTSVRLTLYATRVVFVLLAVLLPLFPWLLSQYDRLLFPLLGNQRPVLLTAFYLSCAAVFPALSFLNRLLKNIAAGQLFTPENVRWIRAVRWCCLAVGIICGAAAFRIFSLVFVALIMLFLCLVVSVVGQVMAAAVIIREENDLTV